MVAEACRCPSSATRPLATAAGSLVVGFIIDAEAAIHGCQRGSLVGLPARMNGGDIYLGDLRHADDQCLEGSLQRGVGGECRHLVPTRPAVQVWRPDRDFPAAAEAQQREMATGSPARDLPSEVRQEPDP